MTNSNLSQQHIKLISTFNWKLSNLQVWVNPKITPQSHLNAA
ncbi:hypothetical protein J717_1461 [Acinetobacter baumannii 121738]|nr:hypothetical protein ACIN5087_0581 [Acinetobacter baumannii OIFC087]EXA56583.1 hypothetical protein J505_2472 [Acinetobacter baumannii 1297549]EXG35988.1 hypothetical protein J717_1461 [Acinetobacter baumannii 121738]EXH89253.1 hypothetical protein J606_2122 [Acinetobacter baumannii 318814]KCY18882.1 hypothetical protein J635_4167 [Acinetobacter baumannii 233846]